MPIGGLTAYADDGDRSTTPDTTADPIVRVLLTDDPQQIDLLALRDGLVETLGTDVTVEPGTYGQLRIVVDRARVKLGEGLTFPDGSDSADLFIPSGVRNGIEVQLDEPVGAGEYDVIEILVDFDIDENFVLQGAPGTPAGIRGVIFTPTLHEMSRSVTEGEG